MSDTNLDDIEKEIEKSLINYSEESQDNIKKYLQKIEIDCKLIAEKIIPGGVLPLYLSPLNSETDKTAITTWEQYNHLGKYGQFADNYCRPNEAGVYQYPKRLENGNIELEPCGNLINSGLKQLTNLTQFISNYISVAKLKLIEFDSKSSSGTIGVKERIETKIKEYERLQQQYLQLNRMLNSSNDLINRRQKIIDKEEAELDTNDNQFNIDKTVFNDFINDEEKYQSRNATMIKWAKLPLFILWVIVVMLALYIDIKIVF